jgi:hypothetical protein
MQMQYHTIPYHTIPAFKTGLSVRETPFPRTAKCDELWWGGPGQSLQGFKPRSKLSASRMHSRLVIGRESSNSRTLKISGDLSLRHYSSPHKCKYVCMHWWTCHSATAQSTRGRYSQRVLTTIKVDKEEEGGHHIIQMRHRAMQTIRSYSHSCATSLPCCPALASGF